MSFRSVVVITCASHAQGPRFDPGRKQTFSLFLEDKNWCWTVSITRKVGLSHKRKMEDHTSFPMIFSFTWSEEVVRARGTRKKNRDGIQSVVRSPNWFQIKSSFMPRTAAASAALQQKRAENDGRKRSTNDIFSNDGSQFILPSNNLDRTYTYKKSSTYCMYYSNFCENPTL